LGSLAVTGNVVGGNLITNSGFVFATGNITGGNLNAAGLSLSGNVISTLAVTSNVVGGNINTPGVVSATGNVIGATHTGTAVSVTGSVTAATIAGSLTTASQPNITGVGTITSGVWNGTSISTTYTDAKVTSVASRTGAVTLAQADISGLTTGSSPTFAGLTVGTGTVSAGAILNTNANGVGNIGNSTSYFNTVFAKATSAQYADLAENYAADAEYQPGTVLIFGGVNEVTIANNLADNKVAGVVSTNPAHVMNSGLQAKHVVALALTGRVPTKVTGTVRKGDMMISAGNGKAQACATPTVGTVIGKAIEDFDGTDGTIEVVVGRL
jgi:hypothetical protein